MDFRAHALASTPPPHAPPGPCPPFQPGPTRLEAPPVGPPLPPSSPLNTSGQTTHAYTQSAPRCRAARRPRGTPRPFRPPLPPDPLVLRSPLSQLPPPPSLAPAPPPPLPPSPQARGRPAHCRRIRGVRSDTLAPSSRRSTPPSHRHRHNIMSSRCGRERKKEKDEGVAAACAAATLCAARGGLRLVR